MRGLYRLYLYLRYYFQPKESELGRLAFQAAKDYYASRPLRSAKNPYPRVPEYNHRQQEFLRFQQAYKNSYRHEYAKAKIREVTIR